MRLALLVLAFILASSSVYAQGEFCLTDFIWNEMVKKDSSLLQKRRQMDDMIAEFSNDENLLSNGFNVGRSSGGETYVIPTVIYVVHDSTPESNISMDQIQSQMDQLNANFDSMGVQFCYAKKNVYDETEFQPQAGDSVGVFRIYSDLTNVDKYTQDPELKSLSNLPSSNYLRIFVVKNIFPQNVLGYAYYPGTTYALDGIVVRADAFGSRNYCPSCNLLENYDLGATLTHEAGHYLNLYHTFQGGCVSDTSIGACQIYGDRVCDTPPTTGSFGCPSPVPLSCDGVTPLQVENYMDYTNDPCKSLFTEGQRARMEISLIGYRSELVSPSNLYNTGVSCVSISGLYANIDSRNFNGCIGREMRFESLDLTGFTYSWDFGDGTTGIGDTVTHTYDSLGRYIVTLTASNSVSNISESNSMEVFITECEPISCMFDKWDAKHAFLDFSSGTPVAVYHQPLSSHSSTQYYTSFVRSDTLGDPLFYYLNAEGAFYNSSFEPVDTMGFVHSMVMIPSNTETNGFLAISTNGIGHQNLNYSLIKTESGVATIPSEKREIVISEGSYIDSRLVAIPNCDGTNFWILAARNGNIIEIYKRDSNDSISFQQSYTFSNTFTNFVQLRPSPDGRKIVVGPVNNTPYMKGFFLLDFDKSSGNIIAQEHISITDSLSDHYIGYGFGFSPNSRFLYLQSYCCQQTTSTGYLYQLDLFSSDLDASKKAITQFPFEHTNGPWLQFHNGPDDKTYIGYYINPSNAFRTLRLGLINFPNTPEYGQNSIGFNPNGPKLKPEYCPCSSSFYYSGFLFKKDRTDAYGCSWTPNAPPTINSYALDCSTYQFLSDDCYSHEWDFGDPASGANNASTISEPQHIFSGPGVYPITLTVDGQYYYDTINIEAPSSLEITETEVIECPLPHSNYSIALPETGVTYSWNVTNGQPAYVSNATDIDIQWDNIDTIGVIQVTATDNSSQCQSTASLSVVVKPCIITALNSINSELNISVVPNPSSGSFFIISDENYAGDLNLKVVGLLGQVIDSRSYKLENQRLNVALDASTYPKGVYLLNIETKNGTTLKKLVKQ